MKEARILCLGCVCALAFGAGTSRADVIVALTLTAQASPASTLHHDGNALDAPRGTSAWTLIPSSLGRLYRQSFFTDDLVERCAHLAEANAAACEPALSGQQGLPTGPPPERPLHPEFPNGSVQELPPTPSSGALALTGLMGVASLRGLRVARGLSFGAFPAWYHGLSSVGAESSVSSDHDLIALPACLADAALATVRQQGSKPPIPWVLPTRLESQHLPPASAPRGPPFVS